MGKCGADNPTVERARRQRVEGSWLLAASLVATVLWLRNIPASDILGMVNPREAYRAGLWMILAFVFAGWSWLKYVRAIVCVRDGLSSILMMGSFVWFCAWLWLLRYVLSRY